MSNMSDLLKKTPDQLNKELIDKRHEQFNLRMQSASGQLAKNHLINEVRKDIARIKTAQSLLNPQSKKQ